MCVTVTSGDTFVSFELGRSQKKTKLLVVCMGICFLDICGQWVTQHVVTQQPEKNPVTIVRTLQSWTNGVI